MTTPTLVSIEFTVEDLDACIALLEELIGLEFVGRARHPTMDATVAQLRSGSVLVNLVCPTDTGQGTPTTRPEPGVSQLTFTLPDVSSLTALRDRLAEAGAALLEHTQALFFLDATVVQGLLGADSAMAFTVAESLAGGTEAPVGFDDPAA